MQSLLQAEQPNPGLFPVEGGGLNKKIAPRTRQDVLLG